MNFGDDTYHKSELQLYEGSEHALTLFESGQYAHCAGTVDFTV